MLIRLEDVADIARAEVRDESVGAGVLTRVVLALVLRNHVYRISRIDYNYMYGKGNCHDIV